MTIVSQPDITYNIIAAQTQVDNTDQKVLFTGQKVAGGTAVAGDLVTDVQNDSSWDTQLGVNSMLATMIRVARKINPVVRFDYIALDDNGSAVSAVGALTIAGAATADGVQEFTIGSEINHTYIIPITLDDTPTIIGDALVAVITADTKVPVTAANVAGVVTLTAVNGGITGNDIGISHGTLAAGITITTVIMANGALDPVLTGVLDVIGDIRYQSIVWPYSDTSELTNVLDARFNTNNSVQDGVGIASKIDTLANVRATLQALNSQSLIMLVDKFSSVGNRSGASVMELEYSKTSQVAAIRSLRLQPGADISQFVNSRNGSLDSFGGPALASKPYFNTPMPYSPLSKTNLGFTRNEVELITDDGGFVLGNNTAGNTLLIGEVPTTYKTDSAGNPDSSFKYLNYVDTISTIREYFYNNLKSRFSQSRLTDGSLVRDYDIANQELIEAYHTQLYVELSEMVLTQSGENALRYFNQNMNVTVDLLTGTVQTIMKTPIVTQLRIMIGTIQLSFSINS